MSRPDRQLRDFQLRGFLRARMRSRTVLPHVPNTTLRWIAHAGLAAGQPGRIPTKPLIDFAVANRADMIELDVVLTADGVPVVYHEATTPAKHLVRNLALKELQAEVPATLTLEECMGYIGGRSAVLLDLKLTTHDQEGVHTFSRWLDAYIAFQRTNGQSPRIAVCTKDPVALGYLRATVPEVGRWLTLPQVDGGRWEIVRQITALLIRHRKEIGWEKFRIAVQDSVRELPRTHRVRTGMLVKLPWNDLPSTLPGVVAAIGANGLCVEHRLVGTEMMNTAHRMGIPVIAWVVNDAKALQNVRAAGVWGITTDRIAQMQAAEAGLRQQGGAPPLAA